MAANSLGYRYGDARACQSASENEGVITYVADWNGGQKGSGLGHCKEHFSFASETLVATFPGISPTLEVSSSRLEGKKESGNTTNRHGQPRTGRLYLVPDCSRLP